MFKHTVEVVTGRMGVPVIIHTMLNSYFEGDGHGDVTCKQSF